MYFNPQSHTQSTGSDSNPLQDVVQRLNQKLKRDRLVQTTTDDLRRRLKADRVVLYHFYTEWEGRVTFESLSDQKWSIFGSTGPAQCFTNEYAALYLAGRVRAIDNIETEEIQPCHRDFLRDLQVRANLVVPILTEPRLWGLLVAHQCNRTRSWTQEDIDQMTTAAKTLAAVPSIHHH